MAFSVVVTTTKQNGNYTTSRDATLAGRTELDLGDQLNALSMHRYLECAEVTITRMLDSRRAGV